MTTTLPVGTETVRAQPNSAAVSSTAGKTPTSSTGLKTAASDSADAPESASAPLTAPASIAESAVAIGTRRTIALAGRAGLWVRRAGWTLFKRSLVIALFLALWEFAPRLGLVDDIFLPPFSTVVSRGWELIGNGQLWDNVSTSLVRSLAGFAIALVTAVPIGIAIAWYRRVADFLNPLLELFRNTAALALLPVFILILGIGETSKIALVVYAGFFPILLNTITGVRTVDPLLVKSAVSLGFSPLRLFQKVILPAAVPQIFTGIRMAASASILVLIAAEMFGARAGLGYLITAAQQNFQIPDMYVGIIAISVVGLAYNAVLVAIEKRLSRWRNQPQN